MLITELVLNVPAERYNCIKDTVPLERVQYSLAFLQRYGPDGTRYNGRIK